MGTGISSPAVNAAVLCQVLYGMCVCTHGHVVLILQPCSTQTHRVKDHMAKFWARLQEYLKALLLIPAVIQVQPVLRIVGPWGFQQGINRPALVQPMDMVTYRKLPRLLLQLNVVILWVKIRQVWLWLMTKWLHFSIDSCLTQKEYEMCINPFNWYTSQPKKNISVPCQFCHSNVSVLCICPMLSCLGPLRCCAHVFTTV